MNSLKIFTVGCMLFSGVAMAEADMSARDPSIGNTTNMDNTGVTIPATNQLINRSSPNRISSMQEARERRALNDNFASTDKVRRVQEALSEEGHNVGANDGVLGARTSSALKEYQRNNNLTVSGKINEETLNHLGIDYGEDQKNNIDAFAE